MSSEAQELFEDRTAIQTSLIKQSIQSEEEIFPWIENHGRNFEHFYNSTSPETRLKWADAVHNHDESRMQELYTAFTAYEAGIQNPEEFLH